MKIKTAFVLSLVVNAVLITTVAYILLSTVPLENNSIIIINRAATSERANTAPASEPTIARLPD